MAQGGPRAYRQGAGRVRPSNGAKPEILVLDDDSTFCERVAKVLSTDYEVRTYTESEAFQREVSPESAALVVDLCLDSSNEQDRSGLEVVRTLRLEFPHVPILVVTAFADPETTEKVLESRATYFLTKPVDNAALRALISNAVTRSPVERAMTLAQVDAARSHDLELVGVSPALSAVREMIAVATRDSGVSVLIEGPTGTGKEVVARSIHASGKRHSKPFVAVPVIALPEALVEAELFGSERGAFTGADQRREGLVELANGGVLFLDEIADLKESLQVKLLRFLESRTFFRLGGRREIHVDVQILAASNRDLAREVEAGRFRRDLYYRIRTLHIILPALKDRPEDVPLLARHFLSKIVQGRRLDFSGRALVALNSFDWPGNVRELRSAVEHGILMAGRRATRAIDVEDLPLELRIGVPKRSGPRGPESSAPIQVDRQVALAELALIEEALRRAHGRKDKAGRLLGLNDRFTLRRRLKRLAHRVPDVRAQFPLCALALRSRRIATP